MKFCNKLFYKTKVFKNYVEYIYVKRNILDRSNSLCMKTKFMKKL